MEKLERIRLEERSPGVWELRVDSTGGGVIRAFHIGDDALRVAYELEIMGRHLHQGLLKRAEGGG